MRGRFGVRQTLGILTGLQALYALLGLAGYFAAVADVVMFTAWSVLGCTQLLVFRSISKHHRLRLRRRRNRQAIA